MIFLKKVLVQQLNVFIFGRLFRVPLYRGTSMTCEKKTHTWFSKCNKLKVSYYYFMCIIKIVTFLEFLTTITRLVENKLMILALLLPKLLLPKMYVWYVCYPDLCSKVCLRSSCCNNVDQSSVFCSGRPGHHDKYF